MIRSKNKKLEMTSSSSFSNAIQFSAVCLAGAFVVLLHYRLEIVETLVEYLTEEKEEEKRKDEHDAKLEQRIVSVESELRTLRRLVQLSINNPPASPSNHDDKRSEAEYVTVDEATKQQTYQISSWTPEQTIQWVEKVLGNNSQSACFKEVDGAALLDMILEQDHGFMFRDKCMFLGVEPAACVALERVSGELVK